jgi:endoglucanase
MNRRTLLGLMARGSLVLAGGSSLAWADQAPRSLPEPTPEKLPRWRGFNLLEMFMVDHAQRFQADDFSQIADLGFNFVRLPLDYRCWTDPEDWTRFRDQPLRWIDQAIELGQKHGIHVQLNFHRAPGYTVARPPEAKSLWTDREAADVCALHWTRFASRYRGVPSAALSFNLFNEPAGVDAAAYARAVDRMTHAIHAEDPARLIVCDGREYGTRPPGELVGLHVAAATRGYAPFHLTHYRAGWVNGSDRWEKPAYPLVERGETWDRARLERDQVLPWKALEKRGVGVMVGEFGAHNQTPHDVVLRWMRDCLDAWKQAGWGWALWNYRGSFGILDSQRADVAYEAWRGHKLDREMLKLLQAA